MIVLKKISNITTSGNYQSIINVDTAHDNLAAVVLTEAVSVVGGSSTDTVIDTVTQSGTLGAKWFVVAYDGSNSRYACDIYALHDGNSTSAFTEYAILNIGDGINLSFDTVADGGSMTLVVDNNDTSSVTIKTQRITINTDPIDTTAIIN